MSDQENPMTIDEQQRSAGMNRTAIRKNVSSSAHVDFSYVESHHTGIHERLKNWARWSRDGGGAGRCPMFRWVKPNPDRDGSQRIVVIDPTDAVKIEKGVTQLPRPHAQAIVWCYLQGDNPSRARRELAVTAPGLMQLIRDGRTMLINRNV